MIYKYRSMSFPVDAQTAGQELENIEKNFGVIDPPLIVDQARPPNAVLHKCFEWKDGIAAEKWREQQARTLIGQIVRVQVLPQEPEVRAFVSVTYTTPANEEKRKYVTIENAMSDADFTQQTIQNALSELKYFEQKYKHLQIFSQLFQTINQITPTIKAAVPATKASKGKHVIIDDPALEDQDGMSEANA